MITRRLLILGPASATVLAGCSTSGLFDLGGSAHGSKVVTREALGPVNRLRREYGLSGLSADRTLGVASREHAEYMARKGHMSHDRFARRVKKHGIALPAAENVAEGQDDVDEMFQAFVRSPKHKKNMLGDFEKLGVGVAWNADNRGFWVMGLSG